MWYVASFVRGMSVDEAIKQLSFVLKKGAVDVKQTILEAQEMAVRDHNVEFKSNLWVGEYLMKSIKCNWILSKLLLFLSAESFCGKGRVFKGVRRHGRGRVGKVEYMHCHYFVRLEEGKPPKNYYMPNPQTPEQQLETWTDQMRKRKIISSL